MECIELWIVRLHIICHTSRKTNHLCSTTLWYFHKMQNAMLILSQETQERIVRELLSRQISISRLLFVSLSCSSSTLSIYNILSFSTSHSVTQSLLYPTYSIPPFFLYLSLSFLTGLVYFSFSPSLSFLLFRFLFLSSSLYFSLPFLSFSFIFYFSLLPLHLSISSLSLSLFLFNVSQASAQPTPSGNLPNQDQQIMQI